MTELQLLDRKFELIQLIEGVFGPANPTDLEELAEVERQLADIPRKKAFRSGIATGVFIGGVVSFLLGR